MLVQIYQVVVILMKRFNDWIWYIRASFLCNEHSVSDGNSFEDVKQLKANM